MQNSLDANLTRQEYECLKTALAVVVIKRRRKDTSSLCTQVAIESHPGGSLVPISHSSWSHMDYILSLAINRVEQNIPFDSLVTHLVTLIRKLEDTKGWMHEALLHSLPEALPVWREMLAHQSVACQLVPLVASLLREAITSDSIEDESCVASLIDLLSFTSDDLSIDAALGPLLQIEPVTNLVELYRRESCKALETVGQQLVLRLLTSYLVQHLQQTRSIG